MFKKYQFLVALLFSFVIFILFISKILTGFNLGFELGDIVFHLTITATYLFSIILFLYFLKKDLKKINPLSLLVLFVSIYHMYILTLGEGVAGNNRFK